MQKVILNEDQYIKIKENIQNSSYYDLIPVFSDYNINYLKRSLLGVYIISDIGDWLILNDHMRSEPFSIQLDFKKVRYLDDSKYFSFHRNIHNALDLKCSLWIDTGQETKSITNNSVYKKFKRFYEFDNFIKNLPEYYLYDLFSSYYKEIMSSLQITGNIKYKKTYTNYLKDLSIIDHNGINSTEGFVRYPDYTFYNLTGRPNGSSEGYNYSALKKDESGRGWIVSRYDDGKLIDFDFKSYHLHLVMDIIKYTDFEGDNIYEYFSKRYLNKTIRNKTEYNKIKTDVLRTLYSENDTYLSKYPFFKKLHEYKNKLYTEYERKGYIKSYNDTRNIYIGKAGVSKLFNYYLQCYETDNSMYVLSKINNLLKNYKSKVILYTYDSFLVDFSISEGEDLFKCLLSCFNFPVDFKLGDNYYKMG